MIIADEPVSALDVSIQAQIINLLEDLQDEFGLTYIFVAHDLGVIRPRPDRIAVMYLGKIVEIGPAEAVYRTRSTPTRCRCCRRSRSRPPGQRRTRTLVARGRRAEPANPPEACRFHTRCPYATEICSEVEPQLVDHGNGHWAACLPPLNREAPGGPEAAAPSTR